MYVFLLAAVGHSPLNLIRCEKKEVGIAAGLLSALTHERSIHARELVARVRMVAQVLVQIGMVPDELLIVDQRRIVMELARDIRMAGHKVFQPAVPAQILIAVIVGAAIAFGTASLSLDLTTNVRIGSHKFPDFRFVVRQVGIVHDARVLSVTLREVRIRF